MTTNNGQSQTTAARSWMLGYEHAKAGLVASMIARFPDDLEWSEYHAGYAIGAGESRIAVAQHLVANLQ